MANTTPNDENERVTVAIRVMVNENDHQSLKLKAVQDQVNLSEIGREFFLQWLDANPHALALVKRVQTK